VKFSIQVNEGPYQHQAADTAYQFAKAALAAGHEVFRVFFYHDGVNNATKLAVPPQDDRDIPKLWSELSKEHDLDLVVCIAADVDEAKRQGFEDNNLNEGFRISGLGQLIEAGIESDRLVVFGA